MNLRGIEAMKGHLTVRVQIDNRTISEEPIADPFIHTTVTHQWSLWDRIKLVFTGRPLEVRVKVCGDPVAHARWFREGGAA